MTASFTQTSRRNRSYCCKERKEKEGESTSKKTVRFLDHAQEDIGKKTNYTFSTWHCVYAKLAQCQSARTR